MPKKTLRPTSLEFQPRPTYPYSPGTKGGGMVYTAGQVAWDKTAHDLHPASAKSVQEARA